MIEQVQVVETSSIDNIPEAYLTSGQPFVIKGLITDWPIVQACKQSDEQAVKALLDYCQEMPVTVGNIEESAKGRLFYNSDMSGFNFERITTTISQFFQQLETGWKNGRSTGLYLGSTNVDRLMPGFRESHYFPAIDKHNPLVSIWVSNQCRIAAHHDVPDNLACCIAGKRRFTLFPPEQVRNLYIGPLDFTPAGQAISLVDFKEPDFAKFPRFEEALKTAQTVDLMPGDVLFIPSMWWHHVEGLDSLNVLINYWWQSSPAHAGAPMDALWHALLNIKSLPVQEKRAWQAMFEHYIFNDDEETLNHIDEDKRGVLSPDDISARKIRAYLLNKLNR